MVEDEGGFSGVGRGRVLAVRLVGTCFGLLGGVAALVGVFWIIEVFRSGGRVGAAPEGLAETVFRVGVPVVISVAGTWFFFRVGQGLRRGSRLARWIAVVLLVPACIPPLVLLFHAIRGGMYAGVAFALVLLAPPASASLLLTDWKTDVLFRPKGAALAERIEAAPTASGSAVGLILKVVLLVLGFVATIVLLADSQRP
jgi:hypothetical protein